MRIGPQELFVASGVAVILVYALVAFPRRPKSGFRVRESDRLKAKSPIPVETFAPPGSPPHVVLGVAANATRREIQKAFRAKMKQFHPDLVGAEGHTIAQALTAARDAMLGRHK